MENTNSDSNSSIVRLEDEERRVLEGLERRIKTAQRIFRDFNMIGIPVSGNVDEGFQVEE